MLVWAEKEIELIQDDSQTKRETDIYHHGPGPISIIWQLPGPPCFSLVTTFKGHGFKCPHSLKSQKFLCRIYPPWANLYTKNSISGHVLNCPPSLKSQKSRCAIPCPFLSLLGKLVHRELIYKACTRPSAFLITKASPRHSSILYVSSLGKPFPRVLSPNLPQNSKPAPEREAVKSTLVHRYTEYEFYKDKP